MCPETPPPDKKCPFSDDPDIPEAADSHWLVFGSRSCHGLYQTTAGTETKAVQQLAMLWNYVKHWEKPGINAVIDKVFRDHLWLGKWAYPMLSKKPERYLRFQDLALGADCLYSSELALDFQICCTATAHLHWPQQPTEECQAGWKRHRIKYSKNADVTNIL